MATGRSVLAKSWAGPDSHTEGSKFRPGSASKAAAGRDYPRPWLSGSKPTKTIEAMDRDNTRPPPRKGTEMYVWCTCTFHYKPKVQLGLLDSSSLTKIWYNLTMTLLGGMLALSQRS